MATTPILNIDTLITRQTVTIDGVAYELRTDKELTIFALARLERAAQRIEQIEDATAEPTPDQAAEYDLLLRQVVELILIAPAAVHAKLLTAHREAIMWTFIRLSRPSLVPTRARRPPETPTPTLATASSSARGSRASSAGRRKAG